MRVLLIDVNCKNSSTGKIVYDLYTAVNESGNEAAVCYGRGDKIKERNIFKFGIDVETYIHALLTRVTGYTGCFSPISTFRLIGFIKKFKPDVVHIHELHAYFVNIKPLLHYIKQRNIPVVWTFHCEYMYTGKCGYAYDCEQWKTECGNCPAIREYPKSQFFDKTKQMFRMKKALLQDLNMTIVAPSDWLANRIKLSFLGNKPICVVRNGIDVEDIFYPRNAAEITALKQAYGLENKKVVLSVAPNIMGERKGGQTVVEISKRYKESNVVFVLVGADDNKWIDNCIFVKKTNNQAQLACWYSLADLFLICSKKENFPTTCLEALCCGAPIVGINSGGTAETAPAPFGIFTKNSTDLLCEAIDTQLSKSWDKDSIGKIGAALYSQNTMYLNYLDLYKQSIKHQRKDTNG